MRDLGIENVEDVLVLVVIKAGASLAESTANLAAPLLSTPRPVARSRSCSTTRPTRWPRRSSLREPSSRGRRAPPGSLVPMLVVSRRAGESVAIGDEVVVTILEVRGDVVRVGIDAPRSIAVHRAELLAQLESSNQEAASPSDETVESLTRALGNRDRRD